MARGARVVLGYLDDELVGTVSWLGHEDGSGEILRLAVLPSHRGNDYGRELMRHAETQLVASGLTVGENQHRRAVSTAAGVHTSGWDIALMSSERFHHLPFKLLFMRKVLASSEVANLTTSARSWFSTS
jgi:GNAT superfamily N-acetyltransferase